MGRLAPTGAQRRACARYSCPLLLSLLDTASLSLIVPHSQARRIETELDSKIDSFTRLAGSKHTGEHGTACDQDLESGPLMGEGQMVDRLQTEINQTLEKLASVNDDMQQVRTQLSDTAIQRSLRVSFVA